ncbi:MAG: TIGR02757 family protein [Spirochaetales bacterium]|nr:TIGR02757 family protein [Spirochaetales bacterium]
MHIYSNNTQILLDSIFNQYHIPEYIHPDPLEFLGKYKKSEDMEIVALIASSFAIGRVQSILQTVEIILKVLKSPKNDLLSMDRKDLELAFAGFKYRFYTDRSLVAFLMGIKSVIREFGSLHSCFLTGVNQTSGDSLGSLSFFVSKLTVDISRGQRVLPDPDKGSACKRLNLFLRWMIRKDDIDPGIWTDIPQDILIIPLDTHMMQISQILGFTNRKSADMKTAIEITNALKVYDPVDPVRFDFSLTRLGIHPDLNYDDLFKNFPGK